MPAFESKPVIINAKRYFEAETLTIGPDGIQIPAGHWLVERNGSHNVLTDERFRELFRPIGKEGVKEMTAEFVDGVRVEYDPDDPVILRSPQWDYDNVIDAEFTVLDDVQNVKAVDAVYTELGTAL